MSVIIRLQGLPWSASAMNIRHFFSGLSIPAGGVHIIGGEGGDAFIAFSSDDDARMAMKKNMCPLNGSPVQLFLSSKSEMQSVIDAARSGKSVPVAGIAGSMTLPMNSMQPSQPQAQSQRQQFPSIPSTFPIDNQSSNVPGTMPGQQGADFNPQMANQFAKNDWQNFQMYGGRPDGNSPAPNTFQPNQRMPTGQNEGRYPDVTGGLEGGAQFGGFQQQGKGFTPENVGQFPEGTSAVPQPSPATAMGAGGMPQPGTADIPMQDPLRHKQAFMNEQQLRGMPGSVTEAVGGIQSENPTLMPGGVGAMGRGQRNFPGQMGMGSNRDAFNNMTAGRSNLPSEMQMGNPPPSMNMPGNRALLNEGMMNRPNLTGEKGQGDGLDSAVPTNPYRGQYFGDKRTLGPDGRQQWMGDMPGDISLSNNQKPFNQDVHGDEKPGLLGREKLLGPEGRAFEQFPYRGDMNRGERLDMAMEQDPKRVMDKEEREAGFAGRGRRMGSRFEPEEGNRFLPDMYPERPGNRFAKDQVLSADDPVPSTRYPPDDDPVNIPSEGRPPGRFPPMRGRPDIALDEGLLPEGHRFPPGDHRRMPYREQGLSEQEQFSERERNFSPAGRRFPPGERFPPSDRQFPGEEPGSMGESRRFPPGPEGHRFPPEGGRFPPDERMDIPKDRVRSEEYMGRRAGDPSFPPDELRFREEEIRRREGYGRGQRGPEDRFMSDPLREGRPGMHPGFRDYDESEERHMHPHERRFPPERGVRGEKDERDMRGLPGPPDERRPRVSRWEREPFDPWQEGDEAYARRAGARGLPPANPDFLGMRRPDQMEGVLDMDQRAEIDREDVRGGPRMEGRRSAEIEGMRGLGPEERRLGLPPRGPLLEGRGGFEGMRGRGAENMRGRGGMEGMRGRGVEGMRGRNMEGRPPLLEGRSDVEGRPEPGMEGRSALPSLLDENNFEYGHGSAGRGRQVGGLPLEEEYTGEMQDFDNRFSGPGGRGALFDRPPRGRGDFFRGRGGPPPPFGRGRGMDMDRRFEDAGPEERFDMDVDARNIGGRPDGPPIRPLMGNQPGRLPDYSVKPGSGKGLLGDAPPIEKEPIPGPVPGPVRAEFEDGFRADPSRRDVDNRMRRSYDRDRDRDRDHRSSDRRGRERDDRRSGERDRLRYRSERDRSDRRRSRSRERERGRSRDRSSSTKKDEGRSESSRSSDQRTRSVHMKNMSSSVSYKDVRRYLHPTDIPFDGLKLINNEQGQRTGEAFVQFRRVEDAARAVRKSGDKMNGHTVQISFCTDADYAKAVDSFVPRREAPASSAPSTEKAKVADDSKPHYVVQLNNLPLNITKQDITQFFKGLTIENNGEAAYIEFDDGGIATGNGFVELKSDIDYKKALTRDGSLMGTVPIRVFPGKKEEADSLKGKQTEMFQRAALRSVNAGRGLNSSGLAQPVRPVAGPRPQPPPSQPAQAGQAASSGTQSATSDNSQQSSDTVCVHIQGLPLLATPKDIREFFSDSQIAQRGINIAHDSRGKPLGEGFVEFKSKADFDKAIKKDKTSLGRHIVAVKPIGKKEMNNRLDNARQQGYPPQQPESRQSGSDQSKSQKPTQDPSPARERSTAQSPSQGPPPQGAQNGQASKPGPKPLLPGPPGVSVTSVTPGSSKMIPPGVLNKSWFYVRCQNFPPDISIAEIMGFFQGFRPIGDSIRLHYSSEGKPTGNAVVGFSTPDEAQSALQRLNMKMCRQNVVSLHPA